MQAFRRLYTECGTLSQVSHHLYTKYGTLKQVFRRLYTECGTLKKRRGIFPLLYLFCGDDKNMNIQYENFGFYVIDVEYLKFLHDNIDSEVRYDEFKSYDRKPFLGIVVIIDKYTYFIPLTSSKEKHSRWKNVDNTHYLVYEIIDNESKRRNDVVKFYSDKQVLKILSALEIKKMIPVPNGYYKRIDFSDIADEKYRSLLLKEYAFCKKIQDGILEKARKIYQEQKSTGKVYPYYCDFGKLEAACDDYPIK